MKQIRRVNQTFLLTVILVLAVSFLLGNSSVVFESAWGSVLLSQAVYVLPSVIYLLRTKESPKKVLRINKINLGTVVLLILFSYFILPFLGFLNSISLLFAKDVITAPVTEVIEAIPLVFSILIIGGIPAVLEESVYRGIFLCEYGKVDKRKGIILSGFLFGLMHMNINQFVYAFVMGVIFALVVEVTGSILSSMIIHFTINSTTVVSSYFLSKLGALTEVAGEMERTDFGNEQQWISILMMGCIAVFTTTVAYFLLVGISRLCGNQEVLQNIMKRNTESEKGKLVTLSLIIGIAICVALMIYAEF